MRLSRGPLSGSLGDPYDPYASPSRFRKLDADRHRGHRGHRSIVDAAQPIGRRAPFPCISTPRSMTKPARRVPTKLLRNVAHLWRLDGPDKTILNKSGFRAAAVTGVSP